MSQTPVSQFMRQDCFDFAVFGFLEECIVENDFLFEEGKTGEVSIAMGAALAAVNDLQFGEREFEFGGQCFDLFTKWAGLERSELVEQWHNEDWIDGDTNDLYSKHEQPDVVEKDITSALNDPKKGAAKRNSESNAQCLTFEHVRDPETECLFIKPIMFL